MPHIIIEHSENLPLKSDLQSLSEDLHQTFAQQETIKIEALKTRTQVSKNVLVASGEKKHFIFVQVRLLPGRSSELKKNFAEVLGMTLLKHVDADLCGVSVEIAELGNYFTLK